MTLSNKEKCFKPLSEKEQWLTGKVVGIPLVKQQCGEIIYDKLILDDGLRIDILLDDLIIIELKAQELYHLVCEAQLLSYLRLTNKRIGYILNSHVPLMKDGIKRMI